MAKDFEIEATPPKAGRVSASRGYMKLFGENPYVSSQNTFKEDYQAKSVTKQMKNLLLYFFLRSEPWRTTTLTT